MSMKIDGQRQQNDLERTSRTDVAKSTTAPGTGKTAAGTPAGTGRADRVDVSPEAQLARNAMQAALDAPSIRPDAVTRGQQALANGTLGADADRLADRLISTLLGE